MYALSALILVLTCATTDAASVVLEATDAVAIAVSADASVPETFAAEELQRYVEQMTGAKWSIVRDESADSWRVTIGRDTSLASDSFRLSVAAEGASLLGGGDRGTLYAVYELLEQMGCRFYAPGPLGEVVPKQASLKVAVQDKVHEPWFIQREIDGGVADGIDGEALVDWSVKNRLNRRFGLRFGILRRLYPQEQERWNAWGVRGGDLQWQWICHNFSFMFPRESGMFASHPEYFALYKGERVNLGSPDRPGYGGGNLCTTHPDVIRVAAEYAIDWFDKHPQGSVVPMWPGDGAIKWCECDNCRALGGMNFMYGAEGSMSRRLIQFVNEVAKLVGEKHPDRLVLLPAYANYLLPEPDMTIEPNVMVQYCYHADYAHGPTQSAANAKAVEQMKIWAAQAPGRFGVWEYFLIGDHAATEPAPVILPLVYRVRDTVQFLKGIDARYYFTQSNTAYQPYNPLLYHALSRYLWDPDLDADALITDFCRHYYGAAGESIEQYYLLLEKSVQASNWQPQLYSDVATPSPLVFTKDVIAKAEALLATAEKTGMSSAERQRMAMLRDAHNFTVQNVRTQTASGLDSSKTWRLERHVDHYVINADGDDVDPHRFKEMIQHAIDTGRFDRNFERITFRAQKRRAEIVFLENDRIQVAIVPEIGGRIVRLIDKASGRNFLRESASDDTLKSLGEAYFNYGGYEEYVGKLFAGPGWEQAFTYSKGEDEHSLWMTLEATVGDFLLKRTCRVPKGTTAALSIRSELINRAGTTKTISLRAHPMFDLGGDSGAYTVHLRTEKGVVERRLADEHDGLSTQPNGLWAVTNAEHNIGVVNNFEAEQVRCYIFNDSAGRYFNFELMGKQHELTPGSSLVLAHRYQLLTDAARQLPALLAGQTTTQPTTQPSDDELATIKPLNGRVQFAAGKVKQAASFDDDSLVSFPAHYIKANAGTIEGWCRLPVSANDAQTAHLLGVGDNNPAWFQISIHEGKLSVLFKNGRSPYRGEGEYYASLAADVNHWKADTWHHFAIVWGNAGAEKSLLHIYIDGQLKAERYTATLGSRFVNDTLALGRSSASAKTRLTGMLDEVRISNYPRTPKQIAEAFKQVNAGRELAADEGTLLMLHMDDRLDAGSRTSLSQDDQTVRLRVREIIDTVDGR